MELGVLIFPTDLSIRPDHLAPEVEARGFESLFVTEHTHIPVSRRTPWPGGPDLPDEYRRTLDPFVALTAAATVTERLVLGTGICLVAQHDPIVLAKQVASLDLVSGGRFVFGIGVGWNEDEMESHGVDPARRRSVAREKVLALQALWHDEVASFEGEFVRVPPSWSWPKPVQQPHPPIVMGGVGGPVTFRHIAEYCDGWIPIAGRKGELLGRLPALHQACEEAGRDPATVSIQVFGAPAQPEVLERYAAAGVQRAVLGLPPRPADEVLAVLDRYVPLLGQFS